MKFTYIIECDNGLPGMDGVYEARMISGEMSPDSKEAEEERKKTPFRASGESPILAIAALGVLAEGWANGGGAEKWLDSTREGQELTNELVHGIPPRRRTESLPN